MSRFDSLVYSRYDFYTSRGKGANEGQLAQYFRSLGVSMTKVLFEARKKSSGTSIEVIRLIDEVYNHQYKGQIGNDRDKSSAAADAVFILLCLILNESPVGDGTGYTYIDIEFTFPHGSHEMEEVARKLEGIRLATEPYVTPSGESVVRSARFGSRKGGVCLKEPATALFNPMDNTLTPLPQGDTFKPWGKFYNGSSIDFDGSSTHFPDLGYMFRISLEPSERAWRIFFDESAYLKFPTALFHGIQGYTNESMYYHHEFHPLEGHPDSISLKGLPDVFKKAGITL